MKTCLKKEIKQLYTRVTRKKKWIKNVKKSRLFDGRKMHKNMLRSFANGKRQSWKRSKFTHRFLAKIVRFDCHSFRAIVRFINTGQHIGQLKHVRSQRNYDELSIFRSLLQIKVNPWMRGSTNSRLRNRSRKYVINNVQVPGIKQSRAI